MPKYSSNDQTNNRLRTATEIAERVRCLSLPAYRATQEVSNKSVEQDRFDPVTETDVAVEEACRQIISRAFPQDSIVGEELQETPGDSNWTWYIDPIDGTRSFVAGLPTWSTLIGVLTDNQKFALGVVDIPALDEHYFATTENAKLTHAGETKEINVSKCRSLNEAIISTTDPFILDLSEYDGWKELRQSARIVRYGLDAYAYARLAAGSIDLVAESGLHPWDMCALVPLVRGAGGVVCDWDGSSPKLGGRLVCAATQPLMDEAVNILSRC